MSIEERMLAAASKLKVRYTEDVDVMTVSVKEVKPGANRYYASEPVFFSRHKGSSSALLRMAECHAVQCQNRFASLPLPCSLNDVLIRVTSFPSNGLPATGWPDYQGASPCTSSPIKLMPNLTSSPYQTFFKQYCQSGINSNP
jgi:hypothetical protein